MSVSKKVIEDLNKLVDIDENKDSQDNVYTITVDIYENHPYPVVRHIFYGRTEKEARGYMKAHESSDKFFGKCKTTGYWKSLKCKTTKPVTRKTKISYIKKVNT